LPSTEGGLRTGSMPPASPFVVYIIIIDTFNVA